MTILFHLGTAFICAFLGVLFLKYVWEHNAISRGAAIILSLISAVPVLNVICISIFLSSLIIICCIKISKKPSVKKWLKEPII